MLLNCAPCSWLTRCIRSRFSCQARLRRSLYPSRVGSVYARELSTNYSSSVRPAREIAIPVPFGHLAAKDWPAVTNEDPEHRLLCLHGMQDNAGSFDPLIQELPGSWRAVVLEFAGHGLSSHLPRGCMYSMTQCTLDVIRAVRGLGWDRFSLLGHSLGGLVGHRYACMFPDKVLKLILIEGFGDIFDGRSQVLNVMKATMLSFLRLEDKDLSSQPSYTEQEVLDLYAKGPLRHLRPEDVKILMKRGCRQQPDGRYSFTGDMHVKAMLWDRLDRSALAPCYKSFCNDLLILNAAPGFLCSSVHQGRLASVLRRHCRSFQLEVLDGDHHIHMSQPRLVASYVNPFLDGGTS